jgi:hypothetical protein
MLPPPPSLEHSNAFYKEVPQPLSGTKANPWFAYLLSLNA